MEEKEKRKTHTSTEVKRRWNAKHYDHMSVDVPKGAGELIRQLASKSGMSVAAYIRHLIREDALRHNENALVALLGGGGSI